MGVEDGTHGQPITHKRKKIGAVPHDLGVPEGDPFIAVNEPGWQDTNDWKDLNSKFVLMVYRDYVLTGRNDTAFLSETWPAVKSAIEYLRQFDHGGGVPENSGYPDQTYDDWVVKRRQCLLRRFVACRIACGRRDGAHSGRHTELHRSTAHCFLKDRRPTSRSSGTANTSATTLAARSKDDIQADQLAGQWYANLTGLGDIVPYEMQRSTLKKIFDFNVMKFGNGEMGAANGMSSDGKILTNAEAKEVWVGTTAGYAALLMSDGMPDEAWKTTWGLYRVIYETKGYWFRTPEAWDVTGNFRAGMYMRPMAIWALEMTPPRPK